MTALPPRAAQALALASQIDPSCDAAAAWLAAHDRPGASAEALARALRAQARRDRRAGGAHGPSRFSGSPLEPQDAAHGALDDPAELMVAAEAVGQREGLERALAEREPVLDPRALAQREGITRRRAQQVLARRREAEGKGQGVLL